MATSKQIDAVVARFVREHRQQQAGQVQQLYEWHCPEMTKQQFWQMMQAAATAAMARRGVHRPYLVDDNNRDIILQMWHYVTGSPECRWNVHKGIYLQGAVGCGKTTLMLALTEVLQVVTGLAIRTVNAKQLYKQIQQEGIRSLANKPLLIDELGREALEVNDFGNKMRPFAELMELRYESGARTFFTSNFRLETLSRGFNEQGEAIGYGKYIGERIQETTNIVTMPGSSRREKWEDVQ